MIDQKSRAEQSAPLINFWAEHLEITTTQKEQTDSRDDDDI